jgi:hypothetical protein
VDDMTVLFLKDNILRKGVLLRKDGEDAAVIFSKGREHIVSIDSIVEQITIEALMVLTK